jgi:hypothetical protein
VRERTTTMLLLLGLAAAALAIVDFIIWLSIDAVDCYPSCSFGQDLSGVLLVSLPVLAALLLVAALVRWVMRRRERLR